MRSMREKDRDDNLKFKCVSHFCVSVTTHLRDSLRKDLLGFVLSAGVVSPSGLRMPGRVHSRRRVVAEACSH